MSAIQQIYCTHCTYGTSALERAPAEMAQTPMGYSARAGSLEGRELGEAYRQVEDFLGYRLPPGTPEDDKLRLRPDQAPRAFLVLPRAGSLEVVGQVCHRQTDSTGRRAGSYFGHLLFRKPDGGARWTARECLKYFAAPGWMIQDAPEIPLRLPPLPALGMVLKGRPPVVEEMTLLSFLTAPASGPFHDPAGLIPLRLRQRPAQDRAALLSDIMAGFLAVGGAPRRTTAVVAEPGLAALLFFGVLRLLPAGPLTDAASISTYDCDPGRRRTSLLATTFHDPARADLPSDFYEAGQDFAVNTFSDRRTPTSGQRPARQYALCVLDTLAAQGWPSVDRLLTELSRHGARSAEDLETGAAAFRLAPNLFDQKAGQAAPIWRRSPLAAGILAGELLSLFKGGPPNRSAIPVGDNALILAIDVLAAARSRASAPALDGLVREVGPNGPIDAVLQIEGVPDGAKTALLVRYATAHQRLPYVAEAYLSKAGSSALPALVERLDEHTLSRLCDTIPKKHQFSFLQTLCASAEASKGQLGRRTLLDVVHKLTGDQLSDFLQSQEGEALVRCVPETDTAFRRQVGALLDELHLELDHLDLDSVRARFEALRRAEWFLTTQQRNRLEAWERTIVQLGSLRDGDDDQGTPVTRGEIKELGEWFDKALPHDLSEETRTGAVRIAALRRLTALVRGDETVIPKTSWDKLRNFYDLRQWPKKNLRVGAYSRRSRKDDNKKPLLIAMSVSGICALVILLLVLWFRPRQGGTGEPAQHPTPAGTHQEVASVPPEISAPLLAKNEKTLPPSNPAKQPPTSIAVNPETVLADSPSGTPTNETGAVPPNARSIKDDIEKLGKDIAERQLSIRYNERDIAKWTKWIDDEQSRNPIQTEITDRLDLVTGGNMPGNVSGLSFELPVRPDDRAKFMKASVYFMHGGQRLNAQPLRTTTFNNGPLKGNSPFPLLSDARAFVKIEGVELEFTYRFNDDIRDLKLRKSFGSEIEARGQYSLKASDAKWESVARAVSEWVIAPTEKQWSEKQWRTELGNCQKLIHVFEEKHSQTIKKWADESDQRLKKLDGALGEVRLLSTDESRSPTTEFVFHRSNVQKVIPDLPDAANIAVQLSFFRRAGNKGQDDSNPERMEGGTEIQLQADKQPISIPPGASLRTFDVVLRFSLPGIRFQTAPIQIRRPSDLAPGVHEVIITKIDPGVNNGLAQWKLWHDLGEQLGGLKKTVDILGSPRPPRGNLQ